MDVFFSRVVPTEIIIQKDTLVLDLGTLSYEQLDEEFPLRLMKVLDEEFAFLFTGSALTDSHHQSYNCVTTEEGYLSILEVFLVTGTAPWPVASGESFDIQEIVNRLYKQNRKGLRNLLFKLGSQFNIRKRLTNQLPEEDIDKIIDTIEPVESSFILSYKKNIKAVQQEKQVVKSGTDNFGKSVCLFILSYLLEDHGSMFSRKMFVKHTLYQVAAHYNATYEALLEMLHEAFHNDRQIAAEKHALSDIVTGLYEEIDVRDAKEADSRSQPSRQVSELQEKMVVIQYYLKHGTLPHWSPCYSKEKLAAYILELIHAVPVSFKEMLFYMSTNGEVAARITAVLEHSGLQELSRLLLPHEADFLGRYVLLLENLQLEGSLTETNMRSFQKLVWANILELLLKNPQCSNQQLIRDSLASISHSLVVSSRTILEAMVTVIRRDRQYELNYAVHTGIFLHLLTEYETGSVKHGLVEEGVRPTENRTAYLPAALKDVLLYLLYYGSIPWWGKEYFNQPPESLLELLFDRSPQEAVSLIKIAGLDERATQRFLHQFPSYLMLRIVSRLPVGVQVSKAFEDVAVIVHTIPLFSNVSSRSCELIMLEVLWNCLAAQGYVAFDETNFFSTVLYNLCKLAGHSIDGVLPLLISSMKEKESTAHSFRDIITQLQWSLGIGAGENLIEEDFVLEERKPNADEYVDSYQGQDVPITGVTPAACLQEFKDAITMMHLSRRLSINDLHYITVNAGYMEELLAYSPQEVMAFMRTTGKNDGNMERMLQQPLFPFFEKWIRLLPTLHAKENITLDTFLNQHNKEHVSFTPEDRQRQVYDLLDYFLTWNRLPDSWQDKGNHDMNNLLEEMMILLYHENSDAMKRLWNNEKHDPLARMQLQHLFPAHRGGVHKNIGLWLDEYIETDAAQYLRQVTGENKERESKGLKAALDQLFKKTQKSGATNEIAFLSKSPVIVRYITRHYDDSTIDGLVERLSGAGKSSQVIKEIKGLLLQLTTGNSAKNSLRLLLNEFNLLLSPGYVQHGGASNYINRLMDFLSRSSYCSMPEVFGNLLDNLLKSVDALPASREIVLALRLSLLQKVKLAKQKAAIFTIVSQTSGSDKSQLEKMEKELLLQKKHKEEEKQKPLNKGLKKKDDIIYIQNAGIVLLHPFLGTYFTRLNLMEKGQFVQEQARKKAVHLLQYLAYKTTRHAEHELALNKVLCNYPLQEPITQEVTVDAAEAALSEEMINVVIQRAGKLSNSSADGFRVSFLHREGALTETDKEWLLRVEQRGYDLFLQRLPWAFGMIKTSWMNKPLIVEWI